MKKQRNKKRLMALLIATVMLMMLAPFNVLADEEWPPATVNQIMTPTGGVGTVNSLENGYVTMQQSIAPVISGGREQENVFDVTTVVTTKETLEALEISPDAAVVLLLDMSNSMSASDIQGTKDAATAFINEYSNVLGDAKRLASVVEFGTNAKTLALWNDVANNAGKVAINAAISSAQNKFSNGHSAV